MEKDNPGFYRKLGYILLALLIVSILSFIFSIKSDAQSSNIPQLHLTQYNKWMRTSADTTRLKLTVQATNEIPYDQRLKLISNILKDKEDPIHKAIAQAKQTEVFLLLMSWFVFGLLYFILSILYKKADEIVLILFFIFTISSFIFSIWATFKAYYIDHSIELQILNTLLK
jgi:hypothetical protein